jgi:hypothetical protein
MAKAIKTLKFDAEKPKEAITLIFEKCLAFTWCQPLFATQRIQGTEKNSLRRYGFTVTPVTRTGPDGITRLTNLKFAFANYTNLPAITLPLKGGTVDVAAIDRVIETMIAEMVCLDPRLDPNSIEVKQIEKYRKERTKQQEAAEKRQSLHVVRQQERRREVKAASTSLREAIPEWVHVNIHAQNPREAPFRTEEGLDRYVYSGDFRISLSSPDLFDTPEAAAQWVRDELTKLGIQKDEKTKEA